MPRSRARRIYVLPVRPDWARNCSNHRVGRVGEGENVLFYISPATLQRDCKLDFSPRWFWTRECHYWSTSINFRPLRQSGASGWETCIIFFYLGKYSRGWVWTVGAEYVKRAVIWLLYSVNGPWMQKLCSSTLLAGVCNYWLVLAN